MRHWNCLLGFACHAATGFRLITLNLCISYQLTLIVTSAAGLHSVAAGRPPNFTISSGRLGSNRLFGPAKEKHEINKTVPFD